MNRAPLLLLSLCACTSLHAAARDTFVHKYSCPEDRVTVLKRPDLQRLAPEGPTPSEEVARDPERLKVWKDDHPPPDEYKYYQVSGCDHEDVYSCTWQASVATDGTTTQDAECSVIHP
jgi:hypothetical protein